VASISKTITAIAFMQLVEQNKISLDSFSLKFFLNSLVQNLISYK
jgi:hypothetical protein